MSGVVFFFFRGRPLRGCSEVGASLTHPFATSIPSPVPNVGDLTNSVRAVAHGTKEAFSESLSTKKVVRVLAGREQEASQ